MRARAVPAHAGVMADDAKIPQFGAEARRELFHQRVLVLDGPLDDDNGTLIATQLLALAAEDEASDIALWIHSPGGSVPSMLAIRDVMRLIPNDVATLALGLACSAGQFLLSAGTKGKRRALPHARILMHQGSAGIGGSTVEVEVQADDLRHMRDTVLGLIADDTGQTRRADLRGLAPRPLVHRRAGAGVRLHRRHRHRLRAGRPAAAAAGGARPGSADKGAAEVAA